jgi:hypothetical protein
MFRRRNRLAYACAFLGVLVLGGWGALTASANVADSPSGNIPFNFTVRVLATDRYQVEVDNTNPTKFIKSFDWAPPSGVSVTKVTSVEGGQCSLDGNGGIQCKGTIYPPSCSCAGGGMIVNFSATGREPTFANGYWTYYGVVGGVTITGTSPVTASSFSDVATCKKGQKSTKAHPCTKS